MNKEEILKQVAFDLNKAKQIHQWLNEAPENGAQAAETRKPVSIHYDEDGKPDGIRICALGEDFGLKLKDEPCGEVDFYEAQKYNPPTKKQFLICAACLDEVNEKLVEAGGDPLEGLLWSGSEYYDDFSWMFNATDGTLYDGYKLDSYGVRGSLAFKS